MEYLVPGIIYECSADGLLTSFMLDSTNIPTVTAWINKVKLLLEQWPNQKPCLMLHDLRKAGSCAATSLLKEKLSSVSKNYPNIKCYHALLIVEDVEDADECASLPIQDFPINSFGSRREAMIWLLKLVNS